MIAIFSQDKESNASAEVNEYLEQQVQTITQDIIPPVFQGIRTGLHSVAFQVAQSLEQATRATVEGAMKAGQMLLRMKNDLKPKEYRIFLLQPGWTPRLANKYIKLAKTFEGFELSKLVKVELTTLFALCVKHRGSVVEKLRSAQEINQTLVEQLIKESRPPRTKPKQQSTPITGWKQDASGGGRHYVVSLYDEQTGISIEKQASSAGVLPQKIIAEAVAYLAQRHNQVDPKEDTSAQMQEFQENIAKMRSLQIENEKLLIEKQEMEARHQAEIAKLEQKVQELEQKLTAGFNQASSAQEDVAPNQSIPIDDHHEDLHQAKVWEDVALSVQCQSDHLLKIVKKWTPEDRQHLVNLLVTHLEKHPKAMEEANGYRRNCFKKPFQPFPTQFKELAARTI